jgi:hypothetical protein
VPVYAWSAPFAGSFMPEPAGGLGTNGGTLTAFNGTNAQGCGRWCCRTSTRRRQPTQLVGVAGVRDVSDGDAGARTPTATRTGTPPTPTATATPFARRRRPPGRGRRWRAADGGLRVGAGE